MGTLHYEIEINDLQTRLAIRYFLLENFVIDDFSSRHALSGNENTMKFKIKLKPEKWDKKYWHNPR